MSFSYRCQISVESINKKLLIRLFKKITSPSLKKYLKDTTVRNFIFIATNFKKLTLIKSPHVFKKSKEQFERRTNKMVFDVFGSQGLKLKIFLNILKKINPSGIVLRIKVKERLVL